MLDYAHFILSYFTHDKNTRNTRILTQKCNVNKKNKKIQHATYATYLKRRVEKLFHARVLLKINHIKMTLEPPISPRSRVKP